MRYIHPAAWGGLLLNGVLIFSLSSFLGEGASPEASGIPQDMMDFLRAAQPVLFLLLGLQAVALALISRRQPAGLVLALVAGVPLAPAALVYIIGCILSHYRWKYAAYASTTTYTRTRAAFRSALADILPPFAFGGFVLGVLCIYAGLGEFFTMFLGLGLTGVYLSVRARKFYALSLHEDYFTVAPGLFTDPVVIPYSTVHEAALYDDESIRFTLEPVPGARAVLTWSLRRVEKKSRREALESLGAVLDAHHVPLR